jgi:rod shape-determining protein MreC
MAGGAVIVSGRTKVLFASLVLIVASLLLTAYSAKHPLVTTVGGAVVADVTAPVFSFVGGIGEGITSKWDRYISLVGVEEENQKLQDRLAQLEGDVVLLREYQGENERLRGLLQFSEESKVTGIGASVIGSDPSGWVRGILLDKGTADGVTEGMAVVHARGIVGQVIAAALHSSRVLLINDRSSGVDALVQGSRARGVLEGASMKMCELQYVTKDVKVKEGELVVTSGMDGVYPPGLPIGTVNSVGISGNTLFHAIEVKPLVDFSRLEEVLVVPRKIDVPEKEREQFFGPAKRKRDRRD